MFDVSPEGILHLAEAGESETVEFKTRLPPDETIARVLTSFANTTGGILLIGVKDDGEIVGLQREEANRAFKKFEALLTSLFQWPPQVGLVNVGGKVVAYAAVDRAPAEFAPVATARGEFFRRVKDKLEPMPPKPISVAPGAPKPATATTKKIKAFVAMSFREEEDPALVDYFRAMERAVEATKLQIELTRMDLQEGDYEISQEIMTVIDSCDMLLTDFTLNSSNVYFELGYARGRDKRIIQTARKGTPLEFDIRNWRTLFYKNATELEQKLVSALQAAYAEIVAKVS